MNNTAQQFDTRFQPGERRDDVEAETPEVREILRKLAPEMKSWQEMSPAVSIRLAVTTPLWIAATVGILRWAGQPGVSAVAFAVIAALQHRCNIIQHEAIHRLFFRNRLLNDLIGHHLFGASILTPHTYRLYHFKHHRELGRESDPDFPGYTQFPASGWKAASFVLTNLVGAGALTRFLAESRSALKRSVEIRTYHDERGVWAALTAWAIVALVQGLVACLFLMTGGTLAEFSIFWVLPELTLTRTLMAIRLMGEHTSRGGEFPRDIRYLVTLPSSPLERFFFSPLNFNYHAEHHLFPSVPWPQLGRLHRRLLDLPEYKKVVGIRKGYLHAVFGDCIRRGSA